MFDEGDKYDKLPPLPKFKELKLGAHDTGRE
jgi:hypothetical protein